ALAAVPARQRQERVGLGPVLDEVDVADHLLGDPGGMDVAVGVPGPPAIDDAPEASLTDAFVAGQPVSNGSGRWCRSPNPTSCADPITLVAKLLKRTYGRFSGQMVRFDGREGMDTKVRRLALFVLTAVVAVAL